MSLKIRATPVSALRGQTGLYDATFFPNTYRQYCYLLAPNQGYLLTRLVEEHFSAVTLTVTQLRLLSPSWEHARSESTRLVKSLVH